MTVGKATQVKKGVLDSLMESNTVYGVIVCARTMHGVQKAISGTRSEVKEVKKVKPVGKVMKVKQHVPDSLMT